MGQPCSLDVVLLQKQSGAPNPAWTASAFVNHRPESEAALQTHKKKAAEPLCICSPTRLELFFCNGGRGSWQGLLVGGRQSETVASQGVIGATAELQ